MAAKLQGRVTNVSDDDLGSSLDGDHAAGATSLKVQNAADFDEDGGTCVINDQQIVYTSCNDDTDTITLAEGLAAAADDGDTVSVWDTLRETIAVDKTAEVDVGPDYADDIEATVAMHLVEHLVEGPRGDDGESVILELDEEDDEWKVVEILGLGGPGASGHKYEAHDVYPITAADVAAGVATVPLSHRPIDESVKAWWRTTPQEPTEYTVNYDEQSITWPLDGFEAAGDRIWVHYAYLKGVVSAPVTVIVPFGSSGWSYKQIAAGDGTDYSAPGFDDSGWAVGAAPFGGGPLYSVATAWTKNTRLWLRRDLPQATDITIHVKIEDSVTVFVNGNEVGSTPPLVGAASNVDPGVSFDVPAGYLSTTNVIAIRCDDEAEDAGEFDNTYADVQITGRLG